MATFDATYFDGTYFDTGAGESLGAGDLTTQYAIWLRGVAPDVTTVIGDRLATEYGYSGSADATTLVARFLQERT